jgi:hypothetical protein
MTIGSEALRKNQYVANGVNTAFTYTFKIYSAGDIDVFIDDDIQVIDTDYTVSGAGLDAGGTVTFISPPASLSVVTLLGDEPFLQELEFQQVQ